jgi:regulatory protein
MLAEEERKLLKRLAHWCALQERSKKEVYLKLESLTESPESISCITSELEKQNFLNETRFAETFARGKFRIKHWGKNKIRHALREKGVSSMLIESALKQIDLDEYYSVAEKLMRKKWMALGKTVQVETEVKIYRFMVARGFDASLAREIWKDILRQSPEHI